MQTKLKHMYKYNFIATVNLPDKPSHLQVPSVGLLEAGSEI